MKIENIHLAFGHVPLLDGVDLVLERGERVCLLGRNGEGKSTLLKVIAGELAPDEGKLYLNGAGIAKLAQEPEFTPGRTVYQSVADGLGEVGALLERYHELAVEVARDPNETLLRRLEQAQHELEAHHGWSLQQRVENVLSRLQLSADALTERLSGGWKRRVALAQALVREPDVLLLDEPTNHLDIEAIAWLEEFLLGFGGTLLFISHDRSFVRRLATRIVELDRGRLGSYPGDYDTYVRRKTAELEVEAMEAAKFDKKLAAEEVWIRQGIKARRTRNEGRVRALERLRVERAERRERKGLVKAGVDVGERSGKRVVEAEHVSLAWEFGKPVIHDFSCTILRGDKIGLIGPNGCGKSTLLKLLLGELAPNAGSVEHGTKLQTAYFDQLRAQLDPEQPVFDVIARGSDFIVVDGRRKHVMSYLGDFLFPPARARSPVKSLSGGERNRLLLARMFTKPANLLVLDEPTNDLDLETLELLESLLVEYEGTLLLVSHDRAFLDNVVTSTFVFEGDGRVVEYVGGYEDWQRVARQQTQPSPPPPAAKPLEKTAPQPKPQRKPSYNEQRELAELPARIEALENELAEVQEQTARADFYKQDSTVVNETLQRLQQLEQELEQAYARWEELEGNI